MKANFSLSKKQLLPPVLTSGALKWIALITMFIDHIGAIILEKGAISAYNQGLSSAFSYDTSVFLSKLDFFIRQIGRISFLLFSLGRRLLSYLQQKKICSAPFPVRLYFRNSF